ncbi:MAG: 50S ribosomal protein L21 [Patescibacteria group bacterium]|jgi:large subunit ribosomal protein L21
MYAVITTGGKQYLVKEGLKLQVEKIDLEVGKTISFPAMLVSNEDGTDVKVGNPEVKGVSVSAKIAEQGRDTKISVIKYKRKVRYRRNVGHRQPFTIIEIEKIS